MFVVVLIVAGAVIIPLWESPSETALAGAEKLEALARECGVGILRQYGVFPEHVPQMAASAARVTRLLRNNPRELIVSDIEVLYRHRFASA